MYEDLEKELNTLGQGIKEKKGPIKTRNFSEHERRNKVMNAAEALYAKIRPESEFRGRLNEFLSKELESGTESSAIRIALRHALDLSEPI